MCLLYDRNSYTIAQVYVRLAYVNLSSREDAIDATSYSTGSTDDSELLADITECLSSSSAAMVRSTSAVSEWR